MRVCLHGDTMSDVPACQCIRAILPNTEGKMRRPRRANGSFLLDQVNRIILPCLTMRSSLCRWPQKITCSMCPRASGAHVSGWDGLNPFPGSSISFLSICLLIWFWEAPEGLASKCWPTDDEAGICPSFLSSMCRAHQTGPGAWFFVCSQSPTFTCILPGDPIRTLSFTNMTFFGLLGGP